MYVHQNGAKGPNSKLVLGCGLFSRAVGWLTFGTGGRIGGVETPEGSKNSNGVRGAEGNPFDKVGGVKLFLMVALFVSKLGVASGGISCERPVVLDGSGDNDVILGIIKSEPGGEAVFPVRPTCLSNITGGSSGISSNKFI